MQDDRPRPSNAPLRLTVPKAADALGVTVDAIRGRIRRGTLDSERESGTVYVWVDAYELDSPGPSSASRRPSDDQAADQSELVEALRDQVSYLREQLDEERRARTEERRRQDTIIAQLMQRIPELEAPQGPPQEPPESPVSSGPSDTREAPEGAHAARERPFTEEERPEERGSWWRRFFGFD